MKLLIINGSPRGIKSNSILIAQKFITGFDKVSSENAKILTLTKKSDFYQLDTEISWSDKILIIFPLYTDCMPALVLNFLVYTGEKSLLQDKFVGYFIQSGFPESKQSTFVAKYLKKYTNRVGAHHIGTIIKGGVEGIQILPPFATKKFFKQLMILGENFARYEKFDEKIVRKFSKPYELSTVRRTIFKVMQKLNLSNFYWNMKLKENNAMHLRDETPYK